VGLCWAEGETYALLDTVLRVLDIVNDTAFPQLFCLVSCHSRNNKARRNSWLRALRRLRYHSDCNPQKTGKDLKRLPKPSSSYKLRVRTIIIVVSLLFANVLLCGWCDVLLHRG
jgi:hypothetical protein